KRVLASGPVNLTDFEARIKDDREANRSSYKSFRNGLKREVERRDLVERSAGRWLGWAAFLLGLAGVAWFVLSLFGLNVGALIVLIFSHLFFFIIGVAVVWGISRAVFGNAGSFLNRMWVRRTSKGALLHARWHAFRRYLADFSRMEESPPASLALWEQFLVYGIALGVAEQVLDAARLHAPPEVAQGGSFYSPGYGGSVIGPTGFTFASLENGFSSAFTPPPLPAPGAGGRSARGGGGASAAAEEVVAEAEVAEHGSRGHQARNCASGA